MILRKVSLSVVLLFILLLAGCGQGIKDPLNWDINEFTFKNQDGEDFGWRFKRGDVGC